MTMQHTDPMRLIVGLDGSDASGEALEWAADLAARMQGRVIAVHAIDPAAPVDRAAVETAFVEEWCRPLRQRHVQHVTVLEDGPPEVVLAAVARRVGADLVVIGRRRPGDPAATGVAQRLARCCPAPVVLTPSPAGGPATAATTAVERTPLWYPVGQSVDSYR